MKITILDDKYLIHHCPFGVTKKSAYYSLDKDGYYECPICKVRIPGLLIKLEKISYTDYYGSALSRYGSHFIPIGYKTIIEFDL